MGVLFLNGKTKHAPICPHCGRDGCRGCSTRSVAHTPTRESAEYWKRGDHLPDHSRSGLYGNGKASLGPADFGSMWHQQAEIWDEGVEVTPEQEALAESYRKIDSGFRLTEHLATSPALVAMLQRAELLGAFTREQRRRVRSLLKEAHQMRVELLKENSAMAAYLRSVQAVAS